MDNRILTATYKPKHPLLQKVVSHFWVMKSEGVVNFRYYILPGSNVNIALNFFSGNRAGDNQIIEKDGLMSCERNRLLTMNLSHQLDLLGFLFHPGAAFSFLKASLEEMTGLMDLNLAVRDFASRIKGRIPRNTSVSEKIGILEEELVGQIDPTKLPDAAMQHAIRNLGSTGNNRSVSQFCEQSGINRRKLERRFRILTGFSPKSLQQANRIQRAMVKMITGEYTGMTALGNHCGYYDQSHFIREFRHFQGMAPGQFFDRENQKTKTTAEQEPPGLAIYSASYTHPVSAAHAILILDKKM